MSFMTSIIEALNNISAWFYHIYLDAFYAGWPLSLIASWFYSLAVAANNLAWGFYNFSNWVSDVASKVANILSWDFIWSKIKEYAQPLFNILQSLSSWWNSIWSVVGTWWTAIQTNVKEWIATATQGLAGLLAAWDTFWTTIFPTLVNFDWLETWWNSRLLGIQSLIDSTIKTWFPFYDDLSRLWGNIRDFFTDPLQWLYNQLDHFFERFW